MRRVALGLAVLLAGCAVGPDYERPAAPSPASMNVAAITSGAGPRFTSEDVDARWWTSFQDPALEDLVARALESNPGLEAAVARVAAARGVALRASSPLLPALSANGDHSYTKQSTQTIGFPVSRETRPFSPSQLFRGTLDMAYEVDLWGRVRRDIETQDALVVATDEDRKTAEIGLIAEVCEAWFDLGAGEAALAIAKETVALREKTLALVRARFDAGVVQELELRRAEGELESSLADLPEAERRRAAAQHRLAVLTGRPADVPFTGRPPAAFTLPGAVPLGVPAALLERRPDIRAAEQRLVSANASIGEAYARFFPRVMIVGQAGAAALDASRLGRAGATLFTIGPSVHLPLFELGTTFAAVLEREARTREAAALYRETVLRAFGEVADALVGVWAHAEVRDHETVATAKAERAAELAALAFAQGATGYLEVLDAQRTLLASRLSLLRAQRRVLQDLVRLHKALGGGWRS